MILSFFKWLPSQNNDLVHAITTIKQMQAFKTKCRGPYPVSFAFAKLEEESDEIKSQISIEHFTAYLYLSTALFDTNLLFQ